jgi:hypothetical protein
VKWFWPILRRVVIVAAFAVIGTYVADYVSLRLRMAHRTSTSPIEVLNVQPTYAVARKDGQAEFDFGDTEPETCVHTLFPHMGYAPCWYVKRTSQKPIPIG